MLLMLLRAAQLNSKAAPDTRPALRLCITLRLAERPEGQGLEFGCCLLLLASYPGPYTLHAMTVFASMLHLTDWVEVS